MMERIRWQPSTALLFMMYKRQTNFRGSDIYEAKVRGWLGDESAGELL